MYKKLFDILGTDQFHWYYTEEKDAKSKDSNLEYYKGEVLWEVDVPIDSIFKIVCSVAWNCLLGEKSYLTGAIDDYLKRREIYKYDNLHNECEKFWKPKTEEQLWELLFLNSDILGDKSSVFLEITKPCTQILLRHPVKKEEWVTKNPFKLDNWWESQK